jgi:hypothetical protein
MNFNGSLTSGTVPLIVSFTDMSTDSPTNGRGILVIEGVIRTESPHRQTSAGDTLAVPPEQEGMMLIFR